MLHQIDDHQLTLLQNGEQFFPRLQQQIDAARTYVFLETYIYAADRAGRLLSDALLRAAARGVEVRVLLDGFGSAALPKAWQQEWRAAGVQLLWFRREIFNWRWRSHGLRRLHRKLAVIDGQVAFIGGINIIDDIPLGTDLVAPRLDYAVELCGSLVEQLQSSMLRLWRMVLLVNFKRQAKSPRFSMQKVQLSLPHLELLFRDNLRHRHQIERAYLRAIADAKREIILANPYFLPGKRFRTALIKAARRGVKVILLLQGKIEYRLQHYATQALYPELLQYQIEIFEYQASFLHAKVAVVDQQWATVGSSNIDPFSLLLAREANLVVRDYRFAGELRHYLLQALSCSQQVVPGTLMAAGPGLLNRLSYRCVRLLLGLLGRSEDW